MYNDFIDDLQGQLNAQQERHYDMPACNRSIEVAIALMRAAEPLDEAAEREHCQSLALRACTGIWLIDDHFDAYMRERAAARAAAQNFGALKRINDEWRDATKELIRAAEKAAELLPLGDASDVLDALNAALARARAL